MSRPEKVEERKFVKRTRELGAECLKQGGTGPYHIGGYNDQLWVGPYETPIFFEFKREGEEPTKRQKSRHKFLKKLGYQVYVVYSAKEAFRICRRVLRSKVIPERIYSLWRLKSRSRVLPRSGSRQDECDIVHLSDFKKVRSRGRADRAGKATHRIRNMA